MKYKYEMIKESEKDAIFEDAIKCMISALEYRDLYTKGHSRRVGEMAALSAKLLDLPPKKRFYLEIAGQLHDIGKIGIPDHILLKNDKLTELEWREMKRHPAISADIISEASLLGDIAEAVYQHHERWDGKGYPDGLKGQEIKLGARILALCDAIDAMASNRAYIKSLTWDKISDELYNNMGSQFDPSLEFLIPDLIKCWKENFESKYDNIVQSNMNVETLSDQHLKIREIIEQLQAIADLGKTDKSIELLTHNMNELASVLRIHLSNEDRYLYPLLMKSKDEHTRMLAESFDKSMGGLSNAFISFKTRYNNSIKISEGYDDFQLELKEIINQLILRLDREDNELYLLFKIDEANCIDQKIIEKFEIFFKACKKYIVESYDQIKVEEKGSSDLVTNLDIQIEKKIIAFIKEYFPEDKIIAEESVVDELTHAPTWLIDPIDGTINFSYGSKIYGIQITRVVDKEPVFSILYLPEMEDFYYAIKGQGAYRNGKRLSAEATLPMRLSIVSFGDFSSSCKASRPYQMQLIDVLKEEASKIRISGSSCMDFSAVASGQTHCHIMFSRRVWEFKGGLLLAEEAGLTSALIKIPETDVRAVCVAHDPKVIERIKEIILK